ncbi:hypothetical protein ACFE04_018116 [Oxalis oulophora]
MPSRIGGSRLSSVVKNQRAQDDEGQHHHQTLQEERQGFDESLKPTYTQEIPKFVFVKIEEIWEHIQCPICLGRIRKTRTGMECLHRFCGECIDKAIRLGRRSLRDDPNYDAIILALSEGIDKYEAETLAFRPKKTAN